MEFIVVHYVPMWFTIKMNSACQSGAKNLHRAVELLRELPEDLQQAVQPVLARNAYWAHPEQVLLAMAADSDRDTRERAVSLIRSARQQETHQIRPFQLPKLQFDAVSFPELIDWERETVTEPPLMRDLQDEELERLKEAPLIVPAYPVHTQAVERAVRTVSSACTTVRGEEARHGLITAQRKHRRILPVFNSKQDAL